MNDISPWFGALLVSIAILAGIMLWGRKGHEQALQQFYQEQRR